MSYSDGKAQLSVYVQAETRGAFDAFAEARGAKKGELVDEALRALMAAKLAAMPDPTKVPEPPKARIGMRVRLPSASFFMSITGIVQRTPNAEIGSSGVTAFVAWFDGYTLRRDELPIEALIPHVRDRDET